MASLVASLVAQSVRICLQETQIRSLGQEDPLEKGMATHSSILAWRFPWIEEPGRLWGCKESDVLLLLSCFIRVRLCDPTDCSLAGSPLLIEFSRQEYWSGLPFPSPGNLPKPGIKPGSPALQADSLSSEPPGKSCFSEDSIKPR